MTWKEYLFKPTSPELKFNDWKFRLYGIPILSVIATFGSHQLTNWLDSIIFYLISLVFTYIYWHMTRGVVMALRRLIPSMHQYMKRLVYQILAIIITNLAIFFITKNILNLAGLDYPEELDYGQAIFVPFALTFSIVMVYESIYLLHHWKEAAVAKESLQKEKMAAKLKGFQNQINPHFLFNSLNTLISFIKDNPDLSEKYIVKLTEVYRYMLDLHDKELIPLKEELRFLDSYSFLMQIRYGNNLIIRQEILDEDRQKFVIPLSLQALVENAIKHNIISLDQPLKIILSTDNKHITVLNNIQPRIHSENKHQGTGLQNIINRYQLLTDHLPEIENNGLQFAAKLPLIKVNQYQLT